MPPLAAASSPAIAPPSSRAAPTVTGRSFPALRSPVYRRFLLAAMVATVGGFMQSTAQGWLVLEITNSPGLLGFVAAAAGLPTLFLAAVAGVLADRLDRRPLLVATNLAGAAFAAILALLTTLDAVEYWEVLVLALLNGVALTVQMPVNQAVVSTIVDRTSIGNAVALNSAQYNLLRILAPGAAGSRSLRGPGARFWVNAVALLLVAILVSGLAIPDPGRSGPVGALAGPQRRVWYVTANRVLAIVVVLP
jgi:MFS family permease